MAAAANAASSSFLKLPVHLPSALTSPSASVRFPSLHLLAASHFSVPLSASHRRGPLPDVALPSFPRSRKSLAASAAAAAGGVDNTAVATAVEEKVEDEVSGGVSEEVKVRARLPCELYVCNIPRSCEIAELLDLFKTYGTVHSVEVSRDAETGLSRGAGYVTMGSVQEAKAAIAALDGSDLGGREMCVKFSATMGHGRKNTEVLNTAPKKNVIFESPHKIYVGNLAWSVKPEDLRDYFSQFGTVVSTRVLYDRKKGRNRVYSFLSFSSPEEVDAVLKTNGSEFHGRVLVVRGVANKEEI